MALSKITLASSTYITSGASGQTTDKYSFTSVPDVSGANVLKPSLHVRDVSVFTQGTAPEETASNTTNDSNG